MRIEYPDSTNRETRTIQDQAYDLFGEILLERETQRLLEEIETEEGSAAEKEMEIFFARSERRHLQTIEESYKRSKGRKKSNRKILPGFIRVAASIVACIALAGGMALASSSFVRVQIMRLLANMTPEYTELILSVERELEVPANWYGHYYPGAIPENAKLFELESDEDYSCVYFSDEDTQDGWKLSFTEYDSITDVRVDTEDARQINSMINGHDVIIMEKEGLITIFWNDGQRLLILQTQRCTLPETITYASNVVMVR